MRIFLFILLAIALLSCNRPAVPEIPAANGTLEINFAVRAGGVPFSPDGKFYNPKNQLYSLDRFQLYICDITIFMDDSVEVVLDEAELLDFMKEYNKTSHNGGLYRTYTISQGNYKGIKFGIGVPKRLNHLDPALYTSIDPLSVGKGMHWDWTSGYIFSAIEGVVDSAGKNVPFVYHTGTDTLYRTIAFSKPEHFFKIEEGKELQFKLELDLNSLFATATDTIDMLDPAQRVTHVLPYGSTAFKVSEKIANNFVNNALYKLPF